MSRPSRSRRPHPGRRSIRCPLASGTPLPRARGHRIDRRPGCGRSIRCPLASGTPLLARAAVTVGSTVLFKDGRPYDDAAPEAAEYLKQGDIVLTVGLGAGVSTSTVWTCDLSAEYVRINAEYRT